MASTVHQYPLPNKHNDVVEDVNTLRTVLNNIDIDVDKLEQKIAEKEETVSDLENRAVHCSFAVENSEIQNIGSSRYVVVNTEGNGFECLEGGGDAGGEVSQCSIKRTDANFDTAWGNVLDVSKNGMTVQENVETSSVNETHIFCDVVEINNEEQLPKVELINFQENSDRTLESNESILLRDSLELIDETEQVATDKNFGLVKIGNGININNGIISANVIQKATIETAGIVKIGNGVAINNGVISRDVISPATYNDFGVVKIGNGLKVNSIDELEIGDMGASGTIYDLGRVKGCSNGIVELDENILVYRLNITADIIIHFEYCFEVQNDFAFILELVSDGSHLVAFNENLNPQMSTLPINRGITKIKFNKRLGVPYYNLEISRLDAPEPTLLTPNYGDNVISNLIVWHNGSDHDAHNLVVDGTSNLNFFGRELYLEFGTLVVVDYVYFTSANSEALGEFYLKGSNDKTNWTTLLYKNGESISGKVYTETKGCYRYYKLYIGWKNSNYPRSIQLWGTELDNNESELVLLTPTMSSNTMPWVTISYSNLHEGSAANVTSETPSTYVYIKYSSTDTSDLTRWIKYEFTEPTVANFLDVCSHGDNLNRSMRWYKLEGSNDNENWTLLLERQYQRDFYKYESRYHEFENSTAYTFYRLTCLETGTTDEYWKIGRFRLFRRDPGKRHLNENRLVPKLSSNSQDGYEASASSQYDGNHAPFYAFDGASNTKWASRGTGTQWLQIKLPTATISNVVQIISRSDGNFNNQAPRDFEIRGSNDGETWTTLTSQIGVSWSSQGQIRRFDFENENAYLYYRLVITANNGGGDYSLGEFIIGNKIREYKRYLEKYDYLVPQMSSNSQDGYVVSASSEFPAHPAYMAFDRVNGDGNKWITNTGVALIGSWLKIKLPAAQVAHVFSIRDCGESRYMNRMPAGFKIQGSNDDSSWTDLVVVTSTSWSLNETKTWSIENETAYQFYRLLITSCSGDVAGVSEFGIYVRHYVQEY